MTVAKSCIRVALTSMLLLAVAATTAAHASTRDGGRAEDCIVHRESRGQNPAPNGAGASGYYQFTPVAWNATVARMGRPQWVGRHAYTFTRAQQRAVYRAAWRHGNGRFYWSARWGAPYACFAGDVKPMRSTQPDTKAAQR